MASFLLLALRAWVSDSASDPSAEGSGSDAESLLILNKVLEYPLEPTSVSLHVLWRQSQQWPAPERHKTVVLVTGASS